MDFRTAPASPSSPFRATGVGAVETAGVAAVETFVPTDLKAVLWDMDGTLVDTEPYWIAAETKLVREHGGRWSPEDALTLVGKALEDSAVILQTAVRRASGTVLGIREIVDRLSAEVAAAIRAHVPWRPGARELLHDLYQHGIRCALVTMSEGPLAREIVAALPLPYFEFLITGDQVEHGKPDPEPYLTAVERLNAADHTLGVDNCVALEDSLPGLASATAAGLVTVGIPHAVPLPDDGAHVTWPTLTGRSTADVRRLVAERSRL